MSDGLFASPEKMLEASARYSAFSDRLTDLIGHIDIEIKAVENGAMAGDAVRRLVEEYQNIRNVSLSYANKLVRTSDLLKSASLERNEIGNK